MFVGEGPGYNEDQQGRPFVGRAGELLDKLLASICWKRQEVFIANVVKCRPPENRDPAPDEIEACAPYLTRQIEVLDPALIVTLGRFSMARFNPGAKISRVHGTYRAAHAEAGAPRALAFFMYHPAAALRAPSVERISYADMEGIPDALLEARARRAAGLGPVDPGTEVGALEPAAGGPADISGGQTEGSGRTAQAAPDSGIRVSMVVDKAAASQIAPEAESKPAAQLTLF
jgi:DNA polymerase